MKKLALALAVAGTLTFALVTGSVRGQGAPPPPPPPPGTIPLPPPPGGNPTATATLTPVPTATSTPQPTATFTPVPVTAAVKLAHKKLAPKKKQKITVTTLAGADVTIVVTFPNKHKKRHEDTAGTNGTLVWQYKQPANTTTTKNVTAKVTVSAALNGMTATAHTSYKIGPGR